MQIMNFIQPAVSTGSTGKTSNPVEGKGNAFQSILNGTKSNAETMDDMSLEGLDNKSLLKEIFEALDNGMSLEEFIDSIDLDSINALFKENPELKDQYSVLYSLIEFSQGKFPDTDKFLDKLTDLFEGLKDIAADYSQVPVQQVSNADLKDLTADLKEQMIQLLSEINALIATLKEDGKLSKHDLTQLHALLKQWQLLKGQSTETELNTTKLSKQVLGEDSKLWEELVQRFEKRSFYSGKNMYSQDANITKQDLANWLQQAMDHYGSKNEVAGVNSSHTAMSKVEQYVIHLDQTGKVERVGAEMVNKFANVIKESQFISRNNGPMKMNILLKPGNLGNITVRLTQVDGEMMVKLLVSSQMAKDMLENNIHQLRHMFSPHQVSVERNEAVTDDEFYFSEQEEEQQQDGTSEEQSQNQQDRHRDDEPAIDFGTIFNQINDINDEEVI